MEGGVAVSVVTMGSLWSRFTLRVFVPTATALPEERNHLITAVKLE